MAMRKDVILTIKRKNNVSIQRKFNVEVTKLDTKATIIEKAALMWVKDYTGMSFSEYNIAKLSIPYIKIEGEIVGFKI